jgi:hypothetical protein
MSGSNPYEAPGADLTPGVDDEPAWRGRWVPAGLLLSAVHFVYAAGIGLVIYARSGTRSWVNIAWLPGCLLISTNTSIINLSPFMPFGHLLLLLGSVATGVIGTRTVRAPGRGWWSWLAWLLWAVWVPVPYPWTPFYWFEAY